ncbi:ferritin-like domain-containing protein [Methyloglobulus sp.]|uniref:ferritin-like domain-containing protein n=1 Tax=Methyloglobulus sp. TaxID=2518622 RepID=UPI0032B8608B
MGSGKYLSVFTVATEQQRKDNFEDYWKFTQQHGGELFEADKDLAKKRTRLKYFEDNPVHLRTPLANPDVFYRNYVEMKDDPKTLDRMTLMLTGIYKFARHEWVGIKGAWDVIPDMANSHSVEDKISRVHLAEEFCHARLFNEMLRTCGLDKVEWVPLSPAKEWVYEQFPKLPGVLLDGPAFVTELMGVSFYLHLDRLFDDVLADEPEVKQRLRELLNEITIDEVAHVGQRRNFLGPIATKLSKMMVVPLFTMFYRDIPEIGQLFNVDQMIKDGLAFDFTAVPDDLVDKSWIPSYCKA